MNVPGTYGIIHQFQQSDVTGLHSQAVIDYAAQNWAASKTNRKRLPRVEKQITSHSVAYFIIRKLELSWNQLCCYRFVEPILIHVQHLISTIVVSRDPTPLKNQFSSQDFRIRLDALLRRRTFPFSSASEVTGVLQINNYFPALDCLWSRALFAVSIFSWPCADRHDERKAYWDSNKSLWSDQAGAMKACAKRSMDALY